MIAVTTHSRTRGLRNTLPMLLAGRLIERELRDAPGCERYANIISGPREFWTLTIWRGTSEMHDCMRGGAHGQLMWQQPHWLESYWGMRWRLGPDQAGEWEGETRPRRGPEAAAPGAHGEADRRPEPETAVRLPPWMQAALGQTTPVAQRQVAGAAGATYRLRVPPWRFVSAVRDLRRLRRAAAANQGVFKLTMGLGSGGALYLLVVGGSRGALDRLQASREHTRFLERWGRRAWWSTWAPEAEFGHWRHQRLRDGQLADDPLLVDLSLPAEPRAARSARQVLRARLDWLDETSLEMLLLLTSELISNSTTHAGLHSTDQIGLQVRTRDDRLRVEVIDRGRPFEPRVPLSKSAEDGSGWGLFMIDKTADRWGIIERRPHRHVWFEVQLPLADPVSPSAVGEPSYGKRR